jgi:hypothetical protein
MTPRSCDAWNEAHSRAREDLRSWKVAGLVFPVIPEDSKPAMSPIPYADNSGMAIHRNRHDAFGASVTLLVAIVTLCALAPRALRQDLFLPRCDIPEPNSHSSRPRISNRALTPCNDIMLTHLKHSVFLTRATTWHHAG